MLEGAPMRKWLQRRATGRAIAIAIAVYLVTLVGMEIAGRPIEAAAPGVGTLDLTFGYDHATAVEVLGAYGEVGRRAYAWFLAIDSVMPVAFAAAALLLVARMAPRWFPLLAVAPLAFMALDLVENAAFMTMLARYPAVPEELVAFARPVTMTKLVSFLVALPTLVLLFVAFLVTVTRRRAAAPRGQAA